MATVTVGSIRRPNRRPDVRVRTQIAAALLSLGGRVARYREGAPSPCRPGEWLHRLPHRPGHLACSGCRNEPRKLQ